LGGRGVRRLVKKSTNFFLTLPLGKPLKEKKLGNILVFYQYWGGVLTNQYISIFPE